MLSYQHLYHAGNLADLHKHAMLATALDYLAQKDKPLTYMETHAGRALYDLSAPAAVKTGEAAAARAAFDRLPADHPLSRAIAQTRAQHGPDAYPGSPLIAALTLRPDDRLHLAELHPAEHAALDYAMSPYPATVHRRDGIATALSLAPPTPRRGLCLIDPSYEIKDDYRTLPVTIAQLHRKWNVGVIMLWYPLLEGDPHASMLAALLADHPEALRHEVRFPPARPGHRMTGSGLFILNPPWPMAEEAARLTRLFAAMSR
jgi:23S rRNA (adenine2030-N6)-methyltransferase